MSIPSDTPAANAPARELASDPSNYRLTETAGGAWVIDVLANHSAAYYLVTHELTDVERQRYRARGKAFLDRLANSLRAMPPRGPAPPCRPQPC